MSISQGQKITATDVNNHIDNKNNPHAVTASQIGAATTAQITALQTSINEISQGGDEMVDLTGWTFLGYTDIGSINTGSYNTILVIYAPSAVSSSSYSNAIKYNGQVIYVTSPTTSSVFKFKPSPTGKHVSVDSSGGHMVVYGKNT